MYKLCKTEESAKRQREMELALFECMKSVAFEDITVNLICEQGGFPRKSFYRYFDNKDSALEALVAHTLQEYEIFPKKIKGNRTLATDLENFFRFWLEKSDFLDALGKNGLTANLMQQALDFSETDRAVLDKFLPGEGEMMQKSIIRFSICGLMSAMLAWHDGGYKESPADMAKVMCRMFAKPLFPNLDFLAYGR